MGKYLRYVAWISANLLVVIFVPWIVPMGSRASVHYAGTPTTPISHVVIIMMENHSFDNLFGTFPGAKGITEPKASNPMESDLGHTGPETRADITGGNTYGFPQEGYVQYTQQDIPNTWQFAQNYGLSDNFFSSISSSSLPNHMAMVAAQAAGLDMTHLNKKACGAAANSLLTRGVPQLVMTTGRIPATISIIYRQSLTQSRLVGVIMPRRFHGMPQLSFKTLLNPLAISRIPLNSSQMFKLVVWQLFPGSLLRVVGQVVIHPTQCKGKKTSSLSKLIP